MTRPASCRAELRDGLMQCERCVLAFAPDAVPDCKVFDYATLRSAAVAQADLIRSVQAGLVGSGDRDRPDAEKITIALALETLGRLAGIVDGSAELREMLKNARRKA